MVVCCCVALASLGVAGCDFYGAVGQDGMGCEPKSPIAADNAAHSIYRDNLVAETASATTWARDRVNETDVAASYVSAISAETDVQDLDNTYTSYCGYTWASPGTSGVAGLTTCASLNSADECEQHELRVSQFVVQTVSTAFARSLLTHEMGHTLGLGHQGGDDDVMSGAGMNGVTAFNSHEKDLLNDHY